MVETSHVCLSIVPLPKSSRLKICMIDRRLLINDPLLFVSVSHLLIVKYVSDSNEIIRLEFNVLLLEFRDR